MELAIAVFTFLLLFSIAIWITREMRKLLTAIATLKEQHFRYHSAFSQMLESLKKKEPDVKVDQALSALLQKFEQERKIVLDIQAVNPDHMFIRSPR